MADIVEDARLLYEHAIEFDAENRTQAGIDQRFRALEGQWDERLKREREAEGRPCFTFDRTGQIVRQVVGDIRLNPPAIKVRPVDGGSDPKLAETLTGLVRNVESSSMADAHYVTAAENAVSCGMGFLRVRYDYTTDTAWEMDFRIEAVLSPFGCVWDPGATLPCREDGRFWFVQDLYTQETFKLNWPKASTDGWSAEQTAGWREGDLIRVAEYWHKKPVKRRLLFMADGRTLDATELSDDEIARQAFQAMQARPDAVSGVLRERKVDGHKICMTLMNGVEQLEETYYWPGQYIPIAPVFGEEIHIGDRTVRRGIIRAARDAQIRYNVQATAMTESAAMAPKPKWIGTLSQFLNLGKYWNNANRNNYAFLPYNPDPQAPGPPQRIQPESPPAGIMADLQVAAGDIEATTGFYRENLGKESNAISGRAIMSRQREGDVGSFLYADNMARGVSHVGRIIVDAMPQVYDRERSVRVLGEDGTTEFITINQQDPITGRIINDISAGRYDVVASVGPAFSTRREEGREFLMALMQALPETASMGADILAGMMDAPGADELAKRFRARAVAMGVAQPKDGEQPPQPPPPDPNAMLAQAEMLKAQAALMKAQTDQQIEAAKLQLEAEQTRLRAIEVMTRAGLTQAQMQETLAGIRRDNVDQVIGLQKDAADRQERRFNGAVDWQRSMMDRRDAQVRDARNMQMRMRPQMEMESEGSDD